MQVKQTGNRVDIVKQDAALNLIEIANWDKDEFIEIADIGTDDTTNEARESLCKEVFPLLEKIGFTSSLIRRPVDENNPDTVNGSGDWLAGSKLKPGVILTLPISDGDNYDGKGEPIDCIMARGKSPSSALLNLAIATLSHPKFESVCQELLSFSKYEISMSCDIDDRISLSPNKLLPQDKSFAFLTQGFGKGARYANDLSSDWSSLSARGLAKQMDESGALDDAITMSDYSFIVSRKPWDIKDIRTVVFSIRRWMDDLYCEAPLIIFRLTKNIVVVFRTDFIR